MQWYTMSDRYNYITKCWEVRPEIGPTERGVHHSDRTMRWFCTELFLSAEDVEARLTDDLTEQLQHHVVVSLLDWALVVDLQWAALMNVILLLVDKAAAYSKQLHFHSMSHHQHRWPVQNKRVRPLRGRPLWGRPRSWVCPGSFPIFTMGISFSVRVKAHIPKMIRKKK